MGLYKFSYLVNLLCFSWGIWCRLWWPRLWCGVDRKQWKTGIDSCTPCLRKKLCQHIFCSLSVKYKPISI